MVLISESSSVEFEYFSNGGGNKDPCRLEDACKFEDIRLLKSSCCLTTRILFTGPAISAVD